MTLRLVLPIAALAAASLLGAASPAAALQDGADRQLSSSGPLLDISRAGYAARVARNTRTGEQLVVFTANPDEPERRQVFGQRLSPDGAPVGPRLPLSIGDDDADAEAPEPAVAYSADADAWLVVFAEDGGTDEKYEIRSRRVSGDGTVSPVQSRVSTTGSDADAAGDALHPAVAAHPSSGGFLVAWDTSAASSLGDRIRVRRVLGTGTPTGGQLTISGAPTATGGDTFTQRPAIAHDAGSHWFVIWYGEPNRDCCREQEIFGQLITTTGVQVGDDVRVTETGPEDVRTANAGVPITGATNPTPSVVFDPVTDEYLVAYMGDPGTDGLVDGEYEVFVQRLSAAGVRVGAAVRISETGADGATTPSAGSPTIARDPASGESVVVWTGAGTSGLDARETDIFGQRLGPFATPMGDDFRIARTGPDGEAGTNAQRPAVVASEPGRYQVVWDGRPTGFKTEVHGDQLAVPRITIGDGTAREGDAVGRLPVTVVDPDPAGVPISVGVAASNQTAALGADALAPAPVLDLGPGATGATVELPILDDALLEGTEVIDVGLTTGRGAIADGSARLVITDDDLPAAGGTTPPATGAGATRDAARAPAKLQVRRARVRGGRLDVLASITARATGSVRATFRAGGRTARFTVPLAGTRGTVRIDRRLPKTMRRSSTGILTLAYGGNARVRPDDVRLRAAAGRALLRRTTSRMRGRQLVLAGTISRRARGIVRARLAYEEADGTVTELRYRARIIVPRRGTARWAITATLPARAAEVGGQADVQFTGYAPTRLRGEQLSQQLSP